MATKKLTIRDYINASNEKYHAHENGDIGENTGIVWSKGTNAGATMTFHLSCVGHGHKGYSYIMSIEYDGGNDKKPFNIEVERCNENTIIAQYEKYTDICQ